MALTSDDIYKRKSAFNTLSKSVSLIDDYFNIEKKDSELLIVDQVCKDVLSLVNSNFTYHISKNGYGITTSSDKIETELLFKTLLSSCIESIENIIKKYGENNPESKKLYIWIVAYCNKLLNIVYPSKNEKEKLEMKIKNANFKIKIFDPSYIIPSYEESSMSRSKALFIVFSMIFGIPLLFLLLAGIFGAFGCKFL